MRIMLGKRAALVLALMVIVIMAQLGDAAPRSRRNVTRLLPHCTWMGDRLLAENKVRAGHGLLVHLHAHRSSGSSMCSMAQKNGMRTPDFGCNPYTESISDEDCELIRGTIGPFMADSAHTCRWGDAASERTAWASAAGGIQFVGEEYYGMPDWPSMFANGQFAYSTTLRNPITRMSSDWYGAFEDKPETPKQALTALPDNLLTRILATDSLMTLSHRRVLWDHNYFRTPGAEQLLRQLPVTEAHYRQARANLSKLSVVLLLEDLKGTLPLMAYKFNWTKVDSVHENGREGHSDFMQNLRNSSAIQIQLLAKNAWDLKLYNDGLQVVAHQLREAIQECPSLPRCRAYVSRMETTLAWIEDVLFSPDLDFAKTLC